MEYPLQFLIVDDLAAIDQIAADHDKVGLRNDALDIFKDCRKR